MKRTGLVAKRGGKLEKLYGECKNSKDGVDEKGAFSVGGGVAGVMKWRALLRIVVYVLIYLGVPIVASAVTNQTVASVLGIIYILLLIPFGILRMIDFYRTNDGTTVLRRVFNAAFRVPLALFGLVCLAAGGAIIGWVLYNVLVERQKAYSGPRFIFGLESFGFGVPLVLYGWYTLRWVVRRKEELSREEQEEFEHEEDDEEHA